MFHTCARAAAVALSAVGLSLLSPAGTAAADPKGEPFPLVCDNGQTYSVVTTVGNGEFTPAFATGSNAVFVPVSFGAFSGRITDLGTGLVVASFTDPEEATKGSGKQRSNVSCTYSFSDVFTLTEQEAAELPETDPEYLPAGTYRFDGSGTVVGKIAGR